MKYVSTAARYPLGLVFTIMGLNGFLHFLPAPPPPPLSMQFVGALVQSHYMTFVLAIQLLGGLLLLATPYVPLALVLLGPVIVNIDLFHAFLSPEGAALAGAVSLLWIPAAYSVRSAFAPLFAPVPKAAKRESAASLRGTSPVGSR